MTAEATLRRALRLRRDAVVAAQRACLAAIAQESDAAADLATRKQAIRDEIAAAGDAAAEDDAVEALGRWLRAARAGVARSEAALQAAEAATTQARAVLAAARSAEASLAAVIEARTAEAAERTRLAADAAAADALAHRHARDGGCN